MTDTNIFVGNAPCSWGTLNIEGLEVGQIAYTQMLDELVDTGFTGTELGDWGFMPTDPRVLRRELERRQVAMLGAYVPVALRNPAAHPDGEAQALRVARLLAGGVNKYNGDHQPFVVLADNNGTDPRRTKYAGRVTPKMSLSETEWDIFRQGAEQIARAVKTETGLRTVFHHHCGGYVETPDETARFLKLTDPDLLGLVFDTGHYVYGTGTNDCQTLLDGLNRFSDRIWYLHFKDYDPQIANRARSEGWDLLQAVQNGIFCELGHGCVDFSAVVAWLHKHNYRGWVVVEQDVLPGMGTPQVSAQRNRDYLKRIGL
jgi:inosose dehydratase